MQPQFPEFHSSLKLGWRTITTVLVTGATGNVGSQVLRELVAKGATVKAAVLEPVKDASKIIAGLDPMRWRR